MMMIKFKNVNEMAYRNLKRIIIQLLSRVKRLSFLYIVLRRRSLKSHPKYETEAFNKQLLMKYK